MLDESARRTLAFNIANNRATTNVADKARALFDWMSQLGAPGEQALIAANNQVSAQSSLATVIDTAAKNFDFMAPQIDDAGRARIAQLHAAAKEAVTDKPAAAPVAEAPAKAGAK